jgi:hypothetical protein
LYSHFTHFWGFFNGSSSNLSLLEFRIYCSSGHGCDAERGGSRIWADMIMIFSLLLLLRVVADVATLDPPEQKLQKNKRPLFDGIFFGWQLILISPLLPSFAIWSIKAGSRSSDSVLVEYDNGEENHFVPEFVMVVV